MIQVAFTLCVTFSLLRRTRFVDSLSVTIEEICFLRGLRITVAAVWLFVVGVTVLRILSLVLGVRLVVTGFAEVLLASLAVDVDWVDHLDGFISASQARGLLLCLRT